MAASISDLTDDVLEERILSKVPMTSLGPMRSTCKSWNGFLTSKSFSELVQARKLSFMIKDSRVCTMQIDLQRIRNEDHFADQPIKQVSVLDEIEVSQVYHCDGLLLCVIADNSRLVVWNPYLGQTRWVRSMNKFDTSVDTYALGYDRTNRTHKILRFFKDFEYSCGQRHELYDFSLDSWKVLADITPGWDVFSPQRGAMSLKGDAYFFVQQVVEEDDIAEFDNYLLCFVFTTESFGPRLPLPFHSYDGEIVSFSCVQRDQFALLYNRSHESRIMEIWVTNKIDPYSVSWTKFLQLDMALVNGITDDMHYFSAGSLFIDVETKSAMVFKVSNYVPPTMTCRYNKAYIIKEDGYFRSVNISEAPNLGALVCSSYVPSLVQLQSNQSGKRIMHCEAKYQKLKRIKRTTHCKQCGQAGHNSRMCGKKAQEKMETCQSQAIQKGE